jgi:hypothetical protein
MAGFSVYYAQVAINHLIRGQAFSPPGTTYLALFVADPTDSNLTANEMTGGWYSRQAVSSWAAPVGSGTSTSNSNQVSFSAVTGGAVTVTHWGLYDASTSGNLLASGAWDTTKTLNVNDVFVVNASQLVLDFQ